MMEIKFGPWLPDQTDYKNPGLEVCRNAIPSPRGYQPALGTVRQGVNVTGTVLGAAGFERADGTPVVVCATDGDLYTVISGTAVASSLSLTLATTDFVVFAQFDTKIYAGTKNGALWVLDDIETDTTFAVASGSPPKPNALGRVGDFLVTGDIEDIDATDQPYRLRWSQFNNPEGTWGTDIATQSGAVNLDAQEGPITAISGGTFGIIFQKYGVSRLTYTGGGSVFDLELYEKNRGCVAPRSVVRVGDIAYFLSVDGFMKTDGSSVQSISQGRVWEWFVENANQTFLRNVIGVSHFESRCVVWQFAGGDSAAMTGQLWFNWETGNWGYVEQALAFAVETGLSGSTLEDVGAIYPDIDNMPLSLDSPEFQASGRALGGFIEGGTASPYSAGHDAGHQGIGTTVTEYALITGEPLEAELVGGSFQMKPGCRTFVRGITPLVENEAQDMEVTLFCRQRMTQSTEASDRSPVGPVGFSPFNHDARYFRVGVTIPQGSQWSDAFGYQIDGSVSGRT